MLISTRLTRSLVHLMDKVEKYDIDANYSFSVNIIGSEVNIGENVHTLFIVILYV